MFPSLRLTLYQSYGTYAYLPNCHLSVRGTDIVFPLLRGNSPLSVTSRCEVYELLSGPPKTPTCGEDPSKFIPPWKVKSKRRTSSCKAKGNLKGVKPPTINKIPTKSTTKDTILCNTLGLTCHGNAQTQKDLCSQILRTPTPQSIKHRSFNSQLVGLPSYLPPSQYVKTVVTPTAHHLHITTGCQPVYGIIPGYHKGPLN